MKRWFYGAVLLVAPLFAAKVELHDGRKFSTEIVEFNGTEVVTDQDTFKRGDVKEIIFDTKGGQETGTLSVSGDIAELLQKARAAYTRFPDAKGILLIDDGRNTLMADRTQNYSYHMAYLVLSEARKGMATFRAYYREGDNDVKVHFARVIKPNGKVIDLDKSTMKIETPPNEDIVFFGKTKWLTFTLPGVEIGDIIEYSYESIDLNPWNKDVFDAGFYFQGDDPFVYSRFVVDVPETEFVKWKTYRMPSAYSNPIIETKDGRKTYTWISQNMSPYVPEPNSPPEGDFAVKMDLTNQENWDELYDWYGSFQTERMKITPEIQKLSDSLVANAGTKDDSIAALYYWVQLNIRYISIKGSASSGVSGHPAQFTLDRGFGDCTDKAILFTTMLRAVAVEAYPVYLGTNDDASMLDPEIPSYYGNHCITQVFLPESSSVPSPESSAEPSTPYSLPSSRSFYLDATGGSDGGFSRYPSFAAMDHGVYSVNALKRQVEIIPVPSPAEEGREYHLDMELDKEGTLTVHYQSFYNGEYETNLRYYWNYFSREEDKRMRFEQMVKGDSPDAELLDYGIDNLADISKQLSLRMTYRIKNYVNFAGPIVLFNLPEIANRYTFNELSLENRKLPLTYSTSEGIRHIFTLKLPQDWKIDYLPEEITLSRPEVSYLASYSVDSLNIIRFEDTFARSSRVIEPLNYQAYKNLLNSVSNYHKKPVLVIVDGGEQ